MRKTILLSTFCFLTNLIFAQTTVEINYTKDKEVYLNNKKLDKSTSFDDVKTMLGQPVVFKEYIATGKVNYHYNELGVSFHTVNGKLLFIGANLNWDGDKNFPEKSFEGVLKIDGVLIDKNSTDEFISKIKAIEILCPIPEMCMTKDRNEKTPILIGFKENTVTQVGFEFH
ncbi:MAG: hypothetical protein WBG90_07850 [Saonia sp.]